MSLDPKNNGKGRKPSKRFNSAQFINWSLSAEEKTTCKAWVITCEEVDDLTLKANEEGYKITYSYDSYGSCYSVAIVPTDSAKQNQGYILTGKGSTPIKAFKQAMFIHHSIMGGDWAAYSQKTENEEFDD